jgi:hypothetical protein
MQVDLHEKQNGISIKKSIGNPHQCANFLLISTCCQLTIKKGTLISICIPQLISKQTRWNNRQQGLGKSRDIFSLTPTTQSSSNFIALTQSNKTCGKEKAPRGMLKSIASR